MKRNETKAYERTPSVGCSHGIQRGGSSMSIQRGGSERTVRGASTLEWEPPTSVSASMEIASQSRASARAHPRSPEKREHAQPSPRNRTEQLTELPPWSTRLLKILRRLQNTGAPVPYSSAHSVSTLCVTMCMRAVAVQARRVTM